MKVLKVLLVLVLLLNAGPVYGQAQVNVNPGGNTQVNTTPSNQATENPLPNGIVTCNRVWDAANLKFTDPCNFNAALQLLQRVISFMFYLSAPIAVIGFLYAGYLYLFAFSKPDNIKKAHGLFKTVLIGFGIMLTAWILVITLVKALVDFNPSTSPVQQGDFEQFIEDFGSSGN